MTTLLHIFLPFLTSFLVQCQVAPIVHPALLEGPQNEVIPSLIFPTNRVGSKNRLRSRVFRDASQGYKGLVDSPRLFRASGRFHKRVQSATTHDIQNVPLPQDSVQIVSYKYDAEKHNETKMTENDIITNEEAEDLARGFERTTMAVKVREDETTTSSTTTTQMPEHNSINEINTPGRPKTFFQTVMANGSSVQPNNLPPFTPPPTAFTMPSPQTIQQQNIPQTFPQNPMGLNNLNPIGIPPHQPTNALGVPNNNAPVTLGTVPINSNGLPPSTNLNEEKPGDNHEQLGCGWDWLSNSCKDVFALNWCANCHDFGNIFLHDCKCVAPLITLPTTVRPTANSAPAPQRHPLFFWLI